MPQQLWLRQRAWALVVAITRAEGLSRRRSASSTGRSAVHGSGGGGGGALVGGACLVQLLPLSTGLGSADGQARPPGPPHPPSPPGLSCSAQ